MWNNANSGYSGYSMSNRAVAAYDDGEKPISKWTKSDIIKRINEMVDDEEIQINFNIDKLKKVKLSTLKERFLECTSWHHTSRHFNETNFYSVNGDFLENLTDETIDVIIENQKKTKEKSTVDDTIYAVITVEVWGGSKKHPRIVGSDTVAGIVKGDRVYYTKNKFYKSNANKVLSYNEYNSLKDLEKETGLKCNLKTEL